MSEKKLEIIGPYTPEHPGPYIIDSAMSSDARFVKVDIHCIVDGVAFVTTEDRDGPWCARTSDLMNAREVPVASEFWINESYNGEYVLFEDKSNAILSSDYQENHKRTIHVREVMPGEE